MGILIKQNMRLPPHMNSVKRQNSTHAQNAFSSLEPVASSLSEGMSPYSLTEPGLFFVRSERVDCGGEEYWARKVQAVGHLLIPRQASSRIAFIEGPDFGSSLFSFLPEGAEFGFPLGCIFALGTRAATD